MGVAPFALFLIPDEDRLPRPFQECDAEAEAGSDCFDRIETRRAIDFDGMPLGNCHLETVTAEENDFGWKWETDLDDKTAVSLIGCK